MARSTLTVHIDGGELPVGKKLIRAYREPANAFHSGRKYLIFATRAMNGELWVVPDDVYLIEGDRLEQLLLTESPDAIANSGLRRTLEEIRASMK